MSEVVAVKQAYHGSRYVIAYQGGALNGWSYPSAESAQADLDNIRAAIAPDMVAEIARLRAELAKVRQECETVCNSYVDENQRLSDRAEAAEAELAKVASVVDNDVRLMDPPDGGDPTTAEKVANLRAHFEAAEARALAAEAKCDALREALAEAQASEAYQRGKAEACQRVIERLRNARALTQETADVGE